MPAKNDDGVIYQADQGVSGVGQRNAVADARAVQLLALMQGAKESLARFRLVGQLGHLVNQLTQDLFTILALQIQINGFRREQIAQGRCG